MNTLPEPVGMEAYYWRGEAPLTGETPFAGTVQADLCVVGGGATGLSAAAHAARAGLKVVLLEEKTLAWAASSRNAGYITTHLSYDPLRLVKHIGEASAFRYWHLAHEATAYLPQIAEQWGIDCDLMRGHVLPAQNEQAWDELQAGARAFTERYGMRNLELRDADAMQRLIPARRFAGGLVHHDVSAVHPVKLMRGLASAAAAAGARLHQNSQVVSFEEAAGGVAVRTGHGGVVHAGKLLLALNAYTGRLAPQLARRFVAVYANMVATAPLSPELERQIITRRFAAMETRGARRPGPMYRITRDGRLLFCDGGPFVGRDARTVKPLLRQLLVKTFPVLREVPVEHVWGGWFGMSMLGDVPDIGRLSPRVHYAQAIPLAWAVKHGDWLTQSIAAAAGAHDYDLLAGLDLPLGPHGVFASQALRRVADLTAGVRGLFTPRT